MASGYCQLTSWLWWQLSLTRVAVVVSEDGENGSTGNVCFEHVVDGPLGIHGIVAGKFVLAFMRDEITGVNTPGELVVLRLVVVSGSCQWSN